MVRNRTKPRAAIKLSEWTSYSAVVGVLLSRLRKSEFLDQTELAAELDISQSTLSRIERGMSAITVEELSEMAEFFGTSPARIIAEADEIVKYLQAKGVIVMHYRETGTPGKHLVYLETDKLANHIQAYYNE